MRRCRSQRLMHPKPSPRPSNPTPAMPGRSAHLPAAVAKLPQNAAGSPMPRPPVAQPPGPSGRRYRCADRSSMRRCAQSNATQPSLRQAHHEFMPLQLLAPFLVDTLFHSRGRPKGRPRLLRITPTAARPNPIRPRVDGSGVLEGVVSVTEIASRLV